MRTLSIRAAATTFDPSAVAAHAAAPARAKGPALVDSRGMTFRTVDRDMMGGSTRNGPCASNRPPLMAASGSAASGDRTKAAPDDGTMRWAYNGKAISTWTRDTKPGDTTGCGFLNDAWHTAKS